MRWIVIMLLAGLLPMAGCSQSSHGETEAAGKTARPSGEESAPAARKASASGEFSEYVDASGNISRPEGFRQNWVHLGSWFVKDDDHADGPGVHDVYATPASVKAFKSDGQWPDGAVLVKTVSGIKSERLTTGNAQWAGDVGVWFVMVRDRKGRFPENKSWGEGWGWALFKADAPFTNTTTTWKGEGLNGCFGCHIPAKASEWVFIDGYPTVREFAQYEQQ